MENKDTVIIVIVIILILSAFSLSGRWYGMMGGFYSGFGYMHLFGWLLMTLFVIALIMSIIWLIKQLEGKK